MEIPLPYGLYHNNLVTIEEVASGLSCRCYCPACKAKLIARKGISIVHHFAHQASIDCFKGVEAGLHRLCMEIIAKEKRINLPSLLFGKSQQYEVFPETEITVDNIKLEYMEAESLVPDIIIESNGQPLLIEITANHRVSPEKKELLIGRNIAGIEIHVKETLKDLFEINDYRLVNRAFRKELLTNTTSKHWIYNPVLDKIESSLRNDHAQIRQIGSFTGEGGTFSYVEDCPLENRVWQGGAKKGKVYACADECYQCDFCIARQKNPEAVSCVGHFTVNEFQQLLQKLKDS